MRIARIILGYLLSLAMFAVVIPAFVNLIGFNLEYELNLWHPRRFDAGTVFWASPVAFLGAVVLALWGIFWMARSWWFLLTRGKGHPTEAFGVEVTPVTQQLVTGGPYARTRNPMVFGYFCVLLALALVEGSVGVLIAVLMVAAVGWVNILHFEEPRLERRFGEAYRQYRRRVPRFVPSLRRGR